MKSKFILLTLACALPLTTTALLAQDAATDDNAAQLELAKKLQNPVAALISVPIQNNWDFGIGPADAMTAKAESSSPPWAFSAPRSLGSGWCR